jgi:CHAT domain-containing protein
VQKAHILVLRGSTKAALELLSEDLPSSLATSDIAVRQKLVVGLAHEFSQQFDVAERDFSAAEQLATSFQPALSGDVAQAQGILKSDQNKYEEAESAFRKSLAIARQQNLPFLQANALGSLGLVAMGRERYDEAIDWFKAALELSKRLGAQSAVAKTLGNMAWSYRELGDFENALVLDKEAEEMSARSGLVKDRVYWLTGISSVYYEQHQYGPAESVLLQALDLVRSLDDKRTLTEFLNRLSEIALETSRIELAEKYYREAAQIEDAGLDQSGVLESLLIKGRIDEGRGAFAEAAKSFQRVIDDPKAESAQKWEAEARLAQIYADEGYYERAENEFRVSLATIESVRSSVQAEDLRLSFLSTAISFYDDYIEFLISQRRPEDALQVAELSRARTLAEGLGTAPKTLSFPLRDFQSRQIAQRTKSILLFYRLGHRKSYIWVITAAKVTCLTLPGATELDPLVKSYREAVLSGRDVLAAGNSEGKKLYTLLIEPAKRLIPPGSRVILLPDGSLYGLNFETLLVSEPKPHFWIEDVTITVASSLTLLSASRRTSPAAAGAGKSLRPEGLGGVGTPVGSDGILPGRGDRLQRIYPGALVLRARQLDGGASFLEGNLLLVGNAVPVASDFPALRQAESEMARVRRYFPDSRRKILAGEKATPAAFLASEPEKFAYLHFVAHGSASRAHPLDSAVILSPDRDSFKLYAREIVKHPLSAYLVTISACNGSGTRAYSGEGLVGLSWAFLRAGAHNVIAALWEVSDASTPELMGGLYGELSRGQNPASALRTAKLSLLRSDSVFKKPFYWAPFQLYSRRER